MQVKLHVKCFDITLKKNKQKQILGHLFYYIQSSW